MPRFESQSQNHSLSACRRKSYYSIIYNQIIIVKIYNTYTPNETVWVARGHEPVGELAAKRKTILATAPRSRISSVAMQNNC